MATNKNDGEEESRLSDEFWARLRGEVDEDAPTGSDAEEEAEMETIRKDNSVSGDDCGNVVG